MLVITFLIYTVLFEVMVWGGFGYAVFVLGHSGWWLLFALMLSAAQLRPESWFSLMDGKPRNQAD